MSPLTAFWIVPPAGSWGPVGYGVTAFDLADALAILRGLGYPLPEDLAGFRVIAGIRPDDLDPGHVVPNMGPIVVRGLWYPFFQVGV